MKILAIDIGSAHIKSVIVESKFKRFDIVLHDVTSVPDAWDGVSPRDQILTPGQLSTLAEIKSRYAGGIDRIVTNLPFSLYSSRFQTFPLKDKRKVQAAVRFAIEDEIPFNFEDCIVTSHLFATKAKETQVLTGFAPIAPLERYIESISSMGLSPDCLMMDEAALAAQFLKSKAEKLKSAAVLNLGHQKSGIFFFREGIPILHRYTMVGGFHVTQAIAQRYSLGMAESELAKIERGFLAVPGMKLNADQTLFSNTIRDALEPVFSDFQQSLMAFSSRYNEPMENVFIFGGSALIPGLPEYLAHRWDKRVEPLQVTKLFPQFSIQPQKSVEWLLPQACALGLSQVGGEGRSQINFRSGKLHVASRGLKLNFSQFVYPAKLAVAIYLVAILSVVGQTFLLSKQQQEKEAQLDRAIQNVIGKVSSSFLSSLRSSPTKLKANINKKIEEQQSQVKGTSGSKNSALELLQKISQNVPPSVITEVKLMDYQPKKISLVLESPSQASAEMAVNTLIKLPFFESPKAGPLENTKTNRKRFTFNGNLKDK